MFGFGNKKTTLTVEGMSCHHCEMTVEKALLEVAGIKTVKADHTTKSVEVEYKDKLDLGILKEKIEKAGYRLISG